MTCLCPRASVAAELRAVMADSGDEYYSDDQGADLDHDGEASPEAGSSKQPDSSRDGVQRKMLVPLKQRDSSRDVRARAGARAESDSTVATTLQEYQSLASRVNTLLSSSALSRTPTGRLPLLCVTTNSAVELRVLEHLKAEEEAQRAKRLKEAHEGWVAWRREKDKQLRRKAKHEADARPLSPRGEARAKKRREEEGHEAWARWRAEKDERIRADKARKRREERAKAEAEREAKARHDREVAQLFDTISKLPTKRAEVIKGVPKSKKLAKLGLLSRNPLTQRMSKSESSWAPHDAAARQALATGKLAVPPPTSPIQLQQLHASVPSRTRRRKRQKQRTAFQADADRRGPAEPSPYADGPRGARIEVHEGSQRNLAATMPARLSPIGLPRGASPFAVPLKMGAKPVPPGAEPSVTSAAGRGNQRQQRRSSSPPRPSWCFDTKPVSVIEEIRIKEAMRARAKASKRETRRDDTTGTLQTSLYDINGRPVRRVEHKGNNKQALTSRSTATNHSSDFDGGGGASSDPDQWAASEALPASPARSLPRESSGSTRDVSLRCVGAASLVAACVRARAHMSAACTGGGGWQATRHCGPACQQQRTSRRSS